MLLSLSMTAFSQKCDSVSYYFEEDWELDEGNFESKECFERINFKFIQIKSFVSKSRIEEMIEESGLSLSSMELITFWFSMAGGKNGGVLVSIVCEENKKVYRASFFVTSKKVRKEKGPSDLMFNLESNYRCLDSLRDAEPIIGLSFENSISGLVCTPFAYYR